MMKITILNGPNLNLLGRREENIYGKVPFQSFFDELCYKFSNIELKFYQTNSEAECVHILHQEGFVSQGIVFNPAALTHQSYAIADAVKAISTPVVEVHISNTNAREAFRKVSLINTKCLGSIVGLGLKGYELAIEFLATRNSD